MTDLTHDGITQPISEWAADYGIPCKLIRSRLRRGWSVERAITEPMQVWRGEKLKADDLEDKPETRPAPAPAPAPLTVPTRLATPMAHPWRSKTDAPKSVRPSAFAKRITFNGESLTAHEWASRIGIRPGTLHERLSAGWPLERALSEGKCPRGPSGPLITFNEESLSVRQWAERLGVSKNTLQVRFARGWSVPRALTTPFAAPRTGRARRRPEVS